jgi:hypothetical protein
MRPQRDIESVLDAWLAPGPTEMPDRLFHDALERIERTPQRRRAWAPRRFTTMFASFKFATAAVIAGLVFALVGLSLWQASDVQQAPAASAAPSPDASSDAPAAAALTPIVAPLNGRWLGPPLDVEGLNLFPEDFRYWWIDKWSFGVNAPPKEEGGTDLLSMPNEVGPGRFQLVTNFDTGGCPIGSVGTYAWSASHGDTRITVEPVDEACPPRAEYLTGEWRRVGICLVEGRDCTGELPAGRFESSVFGPRRDSRELEVVRIGAFSFEVPEGWANDFEDFDGYQLTTSKGYAREAAGAATGADALWISPRPVPTQASLDTDCNPTRDSAVEPTVDGLVGWLTANPNLTTVGEPSTMTIDGHSATVVDFEVDADAEIAAPATCFEGTPELPLFADAWAFTASGAWDTDRWSWDAWTRPGDAWRVILVDLDGQPVIIILDSADPADQAAWVEQAMPVVESFQFPA